MQPSPRFSLATRVFIAMVVGVCLGYGIQQLQGYFPLASQAILQVVNVLGESYVKLLQFVVIPLIFISILSASVSIDNAHALRKISAVVIGVLLITTAIAASIAVVVTHWFHLNAADIIQGSAEAARSAQLLHLQSGLSQTSVGDLILNFIPVNLFYDLAGMRPTSTVATVIAASLISIAVHRLTLVDENKAESFKYGLSVLHDLIIQLVRFILTLTPLGVFALMTKMMATSSLVKILVLLKFLVASYVALLMMFVVHLMLNAAIGISPLAYLQKTFPLLSFAFTSRSSAGAIPLNVETQMSQFGVSTQIAHFSASFGAIMGQNGCAGVYPAMLAMMIAPSVGIDPMSLSFLGMLIAVVTISSLGVAGVGGGATFAALMVLSTLNMPVALAAVLISIEPLIDMGRTALNVSGSLTAGLIAQKIIYK